MTNNIFLNQICTLGIWDSSVPGISFDEHGISNYAKIHQKLCQYFPQNESSKAEWNNIVLRIKQSSINNKYNCIVGVSGGTDSCYLLHLIKTEYGLNPLAVNLDNGWNSEIAVQNIKKVTSILKIDLETYVIEYEEIKDLLKVYMKAGLPWIDNPTDMAIQSVLFKIARKEGIKHIMVGNDFRSEGKQPTEWTYSDQRQLAFLHKKFGTVKLKTYPIISMPAYIYLSIIKRIRLLYPFNYFNYNKSDARDIIKELYGWEYYGEHHHENIFTKWAIGYWMFSKFNIDKRKITYSAQILSNAISREEALKIINNTPYNEINAQTDTEYVIKKLGLSKQEFINIWNSPNMSFLDYPSYYLIIKRFAKNTEWILNRVFKIRPKMLVEMKERS